MWRWFVGPHIRWTWNTCRAVRTVTSCQVCMLWSLDDDLFNCLKDSVNIPYIIQEKHRRWDFSITNAVHPSCASVYSKGWAIPRSHFYSEALIQDKSLFLEGIPPAWLLWYKLASYIYKPIISSKPTEEEDWFETKVKLLVDVIRWERSEFVLETYSYKFSRLKPAIIIRSSVIGL